MISYILGGVVLIVTNFFVKKYLEINNIKDRFKRIIKDVLCQH